MLALCVVHRVCDIVLVLVMVLVLVVMMVVIMMVLIVVIHSPHFDGMCPCRYYPSAYQYTHWVAPVCQVAHGSGIFLGAKLSWHAPAHSCLLERGNLSGILKAATVGRFTYVSLQMLQMNFLLGGSVAQQFPCIHWVQQWIHLTEPLLPLSWVMGWEAGSWACSGACWLLAPSLPFLVKGQ